MAGRDCVLVAEPAITPLDGDFAAPLVAKIAASGVDGSTLGFVDARCATGIIALIGPLSVWAFADYSVLRLTHGCWMILTI